MSLLIFGVILVLLVQAAIGSAFPAALVFWMINEWAPFASGWTDSERKYAFFILWAITGTLVFISWVGSLIRGRPTRQGHLE
jgi:hypothetical protein